MHPLVVRRQRVQARTGEASPTLSPTASVIGTVLALAGVALLVAKMGVTHGTPRFTAKE